MSEITTILWHWDEDLRLSFKWDGKAVHRISVEQGGFGEPEIATIVGPANVAQMFSMVVSDFKVACQTYATKVRQNLSRIPKTQRVRPNGETFYDWNDEDVRKAASKV